MNKKDKKPKRKYYRICGICRDRLEQKDMVRTDQSDTGWICKKCYYEECSLYEYDEEF